MVHGSRRGIILIRIRLLWKPSLVEVFPFGNVLHAASRRGLKRFVNPGEQQRVPVLQLSYASTFIADQAVAVADGQLHPKRFNDAFEFL